MEEDKTSAGEKNMASMEKPLKTLQKIHLTRFRARTCRLREHRVKCLAMHKDYNETQTEPKGSPSQERESSSPSGSSTKQQADTSLEYTDSVYSPGTYILYLPGSDDEDPEEPPLTRTESLMLAHEHIENISNMLDASEAYKSCRCDACVQSGDLMHESSSEQPEGPQGQVDVVEENTWEGTRRPRTSPDEGSSGSERRWQPDRDRIYGTTKGRGSSLKRRKQW
ncbi:uncharacterized protein LOC133969757 isoform X2 [Platichthys flesus]|uniref:uncharacterized protein LOC133969757 isoform X2 n=1 Tax=Platichthys flesus TaxID=8260 RepID=UPI002DBD6E11|nr:uncharacterized protein LOC133969757 isoform X2 [Platichthys flesus]